MYALPPGDMHDHAGSASNMHARAIHQKRSGDDLGRSRGGEDGRGVWGHVIDFCQVKTIGLLEAQANPSQSNSMAYISSCN